MPQIIPGVLSGAPGPAGSPSIGWFHGSGAPTAQTNAMILNAQIGSLYSDYVNGNLWFRGTSGWVQVTIP